MQVLLNKLIINGVKNINKPIELLFSNKTINENIFSDNSKVKAIYGPNGSGESGLISSLYIYKRLILDDNGLNNTFFSHFVYESINKDLNNMCIDIVFSILNLLNDNKIYTFKHSFELKIDRDSVIINKENISILKGRSINDENFKPLITIENGMLKYLEYVKENELINDTLYLNSLNLLNKYSILNVFHKLLSSNIYKDIKNSNILISLFSITIFSCNLVVELNKEDEHLEYINNKIFEIKYNDIDKLSELIKVLLNNLPKYEYIFYLSTYNKDVVLLNDYDKYIENIKKLTNFIKIFKPDLDEILIDKKINDNKFYCDKLFKYNNKLINIEFESTGIKKLVKLYSILKLCANGHIAFIDEMDANLHDVYFTKLIEFFNNDSYGQLCFTTHNLEPIDILKNNSHTLDFLSNDSRIYSWIKDGNNSPLNKYINGLIPYSPFNVESFDFDLLLDEE